jgi:hypothetical protein
LSVCIGLASPHDSVLKWTCKFDDGAVDGSEESMNWICIGVYI